MAQRVMQRRSERLLQARLVHGGRWCYLRERRQGCIKMKHDIKQAPPLEYIHGVFYFEHEGFDAAGVADALLEIGIRYGLVPPSDVLIWDSRPPDVKSPLKRGGVPSLSEERLMPEHLRELLSAGSGKIGRVMIDAFRRGAKTKWLDYLFRIEVEKIRGRDPADPNDSARIADSHAIISVRSSAIQELADHGKQFVRDVVSVISGFQGCFYGFVVCDPGDTTNGTCLYSTNSITSYSHDVLETDMVWWHPQTPRRQLLRKVYWGQYLNAKVMGVLSEPPDVVAAFEQWTFRRWFDGVLLPGTKYVTRFESGSAFLALSETPIDTSEHYGFAGGSPHGWYMELYAWFHVQCRGRGLMA
ncbi:MAG: hypothetical protein JSR77_13120 [Planctomycetes bacterium]|nr:hypothetical protein [Planctomycetota bacterium]